MNTLRKLAYLICLVPLFLTAASISAQSGVIHWPQSATKAGGAHTNAEPAIGSTAIYILKVGGSPTVNATDIVECGASNPYIASDGNGDCYVQTDAYGNFDLTDAYTCSNDNDVIYFEAIGGTVGGTTNNQLALIMVPSGTQTCGYYFNNSSTATVIISDFTNVMAAFGAGAFAAPKHDTRHMWDSFGVYSSLNDKNALSAAFTYVNNQVLSSNGFYSGGNSNVSKQLNTLADVIAYCIDSAGGTGSGTHCGTLFSDTTQGSFQGTGTNYTYAPINTWMSIASIAQYPTNNVSTQFYLISSMPPWQPVDTSAPTIWTVPVNGSSQPTVDGSMTASSATHSTTTTTNTFTITGTYLNPAAGGCPVVIMAGYYASPAATPNCTSTSVTVNVPRFVNKGALAVYVDGVPSTFIPFTIN